MTNIKNIISGLLFFICFHSTSNAQTTIKTLDDVAPVLVLNREGNILSSYLDHYIRSRTSNLNHFIIPISVEFNASPREMFSMNAICSIMSKEDIAKLRQADSGNNLFNNAINFLNTQGFAVKTNVFCILENSGFSLIFLDSLPKHGKIGLAFNRRTNPKTGLGISILMDNRNRENHTFFIFQN